MRKIDRVCSRADWTAPPPPPPPAITNVLNVFSPTRSKSGQSISKYEASTNRSMQYKVILEALN